VAGCGGPKNVTVTGTVLSNGKPVALSPTGTLQVTLMPDVPPDSQYTTFVNDCDKEGKFTIENVPPGKYKIGIEQLDPTPQSDKLNGKFSAANTKIIREIDGKQPLVIDLAKPEGG
jgi:hypothetical protein